MDTTNLCKYCGKEIEEGLICCKDCLIEVEIKELEEQIEM